MLRNLFIASNAEIAKNARTTLHNMTLHAEKVTVNGWVCNNAVVKGEIEVTSAGIMKGRGVFGATTLSGKLIVGNSPGLQTFTDTLTLNAVSETVFSISTLETDAMATTTTYGWESGVNSTIDMSGNNLVWNEGAPSRCLQPCLLSG